MLTGQELLSFVKANPDMNGSEIARATGYVSPGKDGKDRLRLSKLKEALLEAQGVKLTGVKKSGKPAQFLTTVHRNGSLLVGKTYTQKFGVEPGDDMTIVLEEDSIRLVPRSAGDSEPTESCAMVAA